MLNAVGSILRSRARLGALMLALGASSWVAWAQQPAVPNHAGTSTMDKLAQRCADLHAKKNYQAALSVCQEAADGGNATGQFYLGVMYYNGWGVEKDEREAVSWYRKAAEQGDADAQYNLGLSYGNGSGVEQDEREAVSWYRKAAEQGYAYAQTNLGVAYDKGQGVAQDAVRAVEWYRRAAVQGDGMAQGNLGLNYRDGQGLTANVIYAYAWLNLATAADEPHPHAVEKRSQLAEWMTPIQLKEAQRLSREWHVGKDLGRTKVSGALPRQAAAPQPARTAANDGWPARPAKRPGITSCNTQCFNGSCMRTYDDGRHVRFQAQQKWNPLNNAFEWDAGHC